MNAKKYRLLFKVTPAGYFGLPQEGTIVVPGKPGRQMYGPTLDSRSGNFVSYGTLPEYRRDDEGLYLALDLGQSRLTVRDNFFTLEVEAIDR